MDVEPPSTWPRRRMSVPLLCCHCCAKASMVFVWRCATALCDLVRDSHDSVDLLPDAWPAETQPWPAHFPDHMASAGDCEAAVKACLALWQWCEEAQRVAEKARDVDYDAEAFVVHMRLTVGDCHALALAFQAAADRGAWERDKPVAAAWAMVVRLSRAIVRMRAIPQPDGPQPDGPEQQPEPDGP